MMLVSLAFLVLSSSAFASLTQPSEHTTSPDIEQALFPPSLDKVSADSSQHASQTPSTAEAHATLDRLELRAKATLPSSTLSTVFIEPTNRIELRGETTPGPKLLGYTFTQGVFSAFNCLSGTYYSVSGYARCCPEATTDCPVYTACYNNSIVRNDQYESTCNGTGIQTECVTGTIYESTHDTDPRFYVNCWPSWTGGDWKATRHIESPKSAESTDGGNHTLSGGPLAGVIVGAVIGFALLVLIGVFATRLYRMMKLTLERIPPQPPQNGNNDKGGAGPGAGAGAGAEYWRRRRKRSWWLW